MEEAAAFRMIRAVKKFQSLICLAKIAEKQGFHSEAEVFRRVAKENMK